MHSATASRVPSRAGHDLSIALAAMSCGLAIAACGSSSNSSGTAAAGGSARVLDLHALARGAQLPDPSPNGGALIGPNSAINPQSPAFQSARQSCQKLLGGGGTPQSFSESQKLAIIATSKCMRAHGVPDYPDPTLSATRPRVSLELPATINPHAPAFLKAAKDCAGVGDGPPP
jgi:hypothetical protein